MANSLLSLVDRVKNLFQSSKLISPQPWNTAGQQPLQQNFLQKGYSNLSNSLNILTNPNQTANRNLYLQGLQTPVLGRSPTAQRALNFMGNVVSAQTGGIKSIREGRVAFDKGNYLEAAVKPIFGVGKIVSSGLPIFNLANILASGTKPINNQSSDVIRRLSGGFMGGMTNEQMATNVPSQNIKIAGIEFDPLKSVGSMVGFTKNPVWNNIFGRTLSVNKWSPTTHKVFNFLATRGLKGGIEGTIQALAEVSVDATPQEKGMIFTQNILLGSVSEIGVGATSKLFKRLWDGLPIKSKIELGNTVEEAASQNVPAGSRKLKVGSNQYKNRYADQVLAAGSMEPMSTGKLVRMSDGSLIASDRLPQEIAEKMGFQARPIGGTKALQAAEQAKGLTPEVNPLTRVTENMRQVGKTPRFPIKELETVPFSEARTQQQWLSQTPQMQNIKIKESGQALEDIISEGRRQIGRNVKEPGISFKQSMDNLYTQWVDRFNPIVQASQRAKGVLKIRGATLRPEYDPEYLVRRLTGAGGIADQRFKTQLNPILKQIESIGIPKIDMDTYLANKRMAGFGQVGREIYGVDSQKASQIAGAMETKYPQIRQFSDQLYAYQNKGFQEMVDAGFISQRNAGVVQAQNPDYAPLKRVMDEVNDYLGLPTRKTMQGGQPIFKIKGSKRQIESPLESIIGNTFSQRAAIEKNRVAKSIVGLESVAGNMGFQKVK